MSRPLKPEVKNWQHRGRCLNCLAKLAGCRRLRRCACGGRVSYR